VSFDRGVSIGLFLFCSWVLYLALNFKATAVRQVVGPEVIPIGIVLCLMAASVALFVRTLRSASVEGGQVVLPEGVQREDRKTQLLVILGILVYIFALEPLGYIVATTALCIYETAVLEAGHWVRTILSGVAYSVAIYTLFVRFLEIMLPVGLLGW